MSAQGASEFPCQTVPVTPTPSRSHGPGPSSQWQFGSAAAGGLQLPVASQVPSECHRDDAQVGKLRCRPCMGGPGPRIARRANDWNSDGGTTHTPSPPSTRSGFSDSEFEACTKLLLAWPPMPPYGHAGQRAPSSAHVWMCGSLGRVEGGVGVAWLPTKCQCQCREVTLPSRPPAHRRVSAQDSGGGPSPRSPCS